MLSALPVFETAALETRGPLTPTLSPADQGEGDLTLSDGAGARYGTARPEELAEFFRVCGAFITRLDFLIGPKDYITEDGESKMIDMNKLRGIIFGNFTILTTPRV